jgi:predicted TIM-barrel fold metal-dependent hydrolase
MGEDTGPRGPVAHVFAEAPTMALNDLKIVDPHQHFWDLERNYYPWLCDEPMIQRRFGDYSSIRRTYMPDDYRRDTTGHDVVATVHVEAEWDPADPVGETRWLMEVRERHGLPHGIVAQAWPARDDIERVLAGQSQFPAVSAVRNRPVAADGPESVQRGAPGSLDDAAYRAGVALIQRHGLAFELLVPFWHLPEAADLARDFPDLQIILNHTGALSPRVFERAADFGAWREGMAALAGHANVAVKISGLGVVGKPWRVHDHRAIVLETIALFGTDRCMFASNFPVDRLVAPFDTIYSGFKEIVAGFPRDDIEKLFHDNAVRFYRLGA